MFHPGGENNSALAHSRWYRHHPNCRQLHMSSSGAVGQLLLLLLWKDKWKMEFFKHPVLGLQLILGRGGGGGGRGSLQYRVGAETQSKLCVLYTQAALTVLLREKGLWMPCPSPSKRFADEASALNLYSSRAERQSREQRAGVRPQQPVLPSRWAAVFSIKCSF